MDNRRRILDMLAEGKINAEEAERLLAAVDEPSGGPGEAVAAPRVAKSNVKYLRVVVAPAEGPGAKQEHVNVRVPVGLLRAGMKFASLIPAAASDSINAELEKKGIDLDVRNIKLDDLETLVDAMEELEVNVQNDKETVRVYFE
jgi:hypothetical protein